MLFEIVKFSINMVCITLFVTHIIEKSSIYNIKCLYLRECLKQEDKTIIAHLADDYNSIIKLIKNHMYFFRISIPAFSLGIFLTYCLQQQKQVPYTVECVLPTIIMVIVGTIVYIIYKKISPQNNLNSQDISINMVCSALVFAGCILSISMEAAVLAVSIVIGKYITFDILPLILNSKFSFNESIIKFFKSDSYVLQRTMVLTYMMLYWIFFVVTNGTNLDEYSIRLIVCLIYFHASYVIIKNSYLRIIQRLKIEYIIKEEKKDIQKHDI